MSDIPAAPDLKEVRFLNELPERRRQFLVSRLKARHYSAGTQIHKQGRRGGFLGILESGEVLLESPDSQPRTLKPGEHFGSAMLLYGKPSAFTITAVSDTTLWVLGRRDWLSPTIIPPPSRKPLLKPKQVRALITGTILTAGLAMFIAILGPSLLDRTTTTLPKRLAESDRAAWAEWYLQVLTSWQPDSALNFGYLGDILVLEGKDQEAIQAYQKALELDEYLPWIHNNLGVLLLEGDQLDLAADHFQQAVDLSPQNVTAFVNLGSAYYAQEDWEAAAAAYGNALDLDFSLQDTKAAWAGLILSESRLVEARLVWEYVLLENPRHPLALQGLGVVSLLEGDPTLAMMYLDAAQYLQPENPALYLYMGMALEELEKYPDAADAYQFAAKNGTNSELVSLSEALLEVVLEEVEGEN
jgi:CRP-like cAMP-binding protein/lipoprotein NlpI